MPFLSSHCAPLIALKQRKGLFQQKPPTQTLNKRDVDYKNAGIYMCYSLQWLFPSSILFELFHKTTHSVNNQRNTQRAKKKSEISQREPEATKIHTHSKEWPAQWSTTPGSKADQTWTLWPWVWSHVWVSVSSVEVLLGYISNYKVGSEFDLKAALIFVLKLQHSAWSSTAMSNQFICQGSSQYPQWKFNLQHRWNSHDTQKHDYGC